MRERFSLNSFCVRMAREPGSFRLEAVRDDILETFGVPREPDPAIEILASTVGSRTSCTEKQSRAAFGNALAKQPAEAVHVAGVGMHAASH